MSAAPHASASAPAALASLFPPGVVAIVASQRGARGADAAPLAGLADAERAQISGAGAKRQREFAAGRRGAREALSRLGVDDFALLNDADRAPIWPPGIVGSITHCPGLCAVAVAREAQLISLGLDAEDSAPLSQRLVDRICTPGEANRLAAYPPAPGVDWAKLTFSAKESVYKCYFPLARTVLGFRDVELEFAPDERRFVAHLARDSAPSAAGVRSFHGRYRVEGDHVITGVTLPALDPASGTGDP